MPDKIPSSTPLTVLSADDPKERTIGFAVHEYMGCELFKIVDGKVGEPVPATEDLVMGQEYCSPGLFGGYHVGVVKQHSEGTLYLDCGGLVTTDLQRDADDRHAWTVGGWINMNALKKLTVNR